MENIKIINFYDKATFKLKSIISVLFYCAFFGVNLFLFENFIRTGIPVDWPFHVKFALDSGFAIPPNFLLHILIQFFGGSSLALAAIAAAAKTSCLIILARLYFSSNNQMQGLFLGTCVGLAMPLFFLSVDPRPYLGTFSPNVAHNPTYILMTPFALLLWRSFSRKLAYWSADRDTPVSIVWFIGFTILSVITALAKPSLHLSLIPTAAILCCILLFKQPARFLPLILMGGALALPVLLQMFALNGMLPAQSLESNFIIAPFQALAIHVKDPLGAVVSSLMFPIAVAALFFRSASKNQFFAWSWLLFVCSLGIAILFAEDGQRIAHANFYWTVYIAVYILFAEAAVLVGKLFHSREDRPVVYAVMVILALHGTAGALYISAVAGGMDPLFVTYDWPLLGG